MKIFAAGWQTLPFDDSGWIASQLPFGYDDNADIVALFKTNVRVSTSYHRLKFTILQPSMDILTQLGTALLHLACDDRCVAFVNNNRVLNEPAGSNHDYVYWSSIVPFPVTSLVVGENILAVQVFNDGATSSDTFLDAMIIGDNVLLTLDGSYRHIAPIPMVKISHKILSVACVNVARTLHRMKVG